MTTLVPAGLRDDHQVVLRPLALAIGATTVGAGLVQVVAPGFVLRLLDAESTTATRHLFAIVGMFMAVVGGLLLHALRTRSDLRLALLWGALQKAGAAIMVTLAVSSDVFSPLGLVVALNDALSCCVLFGYLRSLERS